MLQLKQSQVDIKILVIYMKVNFIILKGSGKTLAFLVPVLQILKERELEQKWKKHEIGAVILSPTRDLAIQTNIVLEQLLKHIMVYLIETNKPFTVY